MVVVNNKRHANFAPLTEVEKREQHSSSKQRGRGETEDDYGGTGSKRRRPDSKRKRTLTTVKEEVCNKRIRLFKWKESLFNEEFSESDTGIVMVYVNNNIKDTTQNPDGTTVEHEPKKNNIIESVSLFKLELFQNIGDFWHSLAVLSLAASNAFEEFNTIKALADEISTYISSNFRFACPQRTGRVVIFVEVDVYTTKEYTTVIINDADNGGTDQEENNDQFDQQSYLCIQLENDSMAEETGEEEEIQLKVDDNMEDVSGVVVSSPELMEIQGMLWRCLEGWPHVVIRVDPDFSRDSKGLKQVEDAVEIITEFHGNNKKLNSSCPCCLEEFSQGGATAVKTRCLHLFHRHCLCLWLSEKDSCPLCRLPCTTLV